jgi:DNA-binding NarL/FixJ family response regulator
MIHILLVEDHTMVRAGLRALLERAEDIKIVGEASNGQEAIEMTTALKPDMLVMDIMMPRMNGIQAAEQIRSLKLPVSILLLSMYSDEGLIHQAIHSGVKGFVLKTSVSEELLEAIHAVALGKIFLSKSVSSIVMDRVTRPYARQTDNPMDSLSPREKEIMQLVAEENTSSEIGKLLFISEKTVEKHRANLMVKLHVRNLAGLVRLAIKYGLVDKDL